MKISSKIISILLFFSILVSCAEQGGPFNKQQVGTVLGGVGGAILGSNIGKGKGNIAAIALGTLAGAAVGSSLGSSLDRVDQQYMTSTAQSTLERAPSGHTMEWRNPDTGHSGTITPTKTLQLASGEYCREFTQKIRVGDKVEEAYGRACRQPDNTWKIVQ
ncbi:MAG: RT0821/Lpp0805 family surface protein [Alphaproteobacteria bacterium]